MTGFFILASSVPAEGLEPSCCRILNSMRMPFRHAGLIKDGFCHRRNHQNSRPFGPFPGLWVSSEQDLASVSDPGLQSHAFPLRSYPRVCLSPLLLRSIRTGVP